MTQPDQPNDTGAQQPAEALRATAKQLQQKAGAVLAAVTPQAASAAAAAQNRFGKVFAGLRQSALLGKVLPRVEAFADWIAGIARIRWMLAATSPAQTSPAEFKLFLLFFGALALTASLWFIIIIDELFTREFSGTLSDMFYIFIALLLALPLPLLFSGKRAILNLQVPRYVSFSGRAERQEFFAACIFFVIMAPLLSASTGTMTEKILGKVFDYKNAGTIAVYVWCIVVLLLLLPVFATCARRLHDIGRSGWIQLPLHVVPVIVPKVVMRVIAGGKGEVDLLGAIEASCGDVNDINLNPICVMGVVAHYEKMARQEMWAVYIMMLFCIAVSIFLFYGRKGQDGRNRFGDEAPRLRDIKPFQEQAPAQHAAAADAGIAQSAAATPPSAADAVDDTPLGRE